MIRNLGVTLLLIGLAISVCAQQSHQEQPSVKLDQGGPIVRIQPIPVSPVTIPRSNSVEVRSDLEIYEHIGREEQLGRDLENRISELRSDVANGFTKLNDQFTKIDKRIDPLEEFYKRAIWIGGLIVTLIGFFGFRDKIIPYLKSKFETPSPK